MRVLFTIPPGQGALHAALPLASALEEAGHETAFCSAASFEPQVKLYGRRYFTAGVDWLVNDARLLRRLADATGPDLSALAGPDPDTWAHWATNNWFMRNAARAMYADVRDIAAAWNADLIAPNMIELGGFIAAEKLGIPHVSIGGGAGTARDLTMQLVEPMMWLRDAVGLPPDPLVSVLYRYLHLSFTPPMFDGSKAVFPPTIRFLRRGECLQNGERLPEWVSDISLPLVLVSLGTVFHRFIDVYRAIIEQLRDEKVEVGVAVGFDQDPECLGQQPPNVHVERWLPLPLLFPMCDVFVTHGGFNSTMEALAKGVPLVVIPMAGDQPYCARRCECLGVGRAVLPHQRLSEQIRDAVGIVLGDQSYRRAARQISAANEALTSADAIIPLLEGLAK